MREIKHKDIVDLVGKDVGGYKLFRLVGNKMVSANTFHGNPLEYGVGKITEDAKDGEGIFVYDNAAIAKTYCPVTADAVILAKVIPIGLIEEFDNWNTYRAVYVTEIVENLVGFEIGAIYFAPKKAEFFRLVKKNANGSFECSVFTETYEEALEETETQTLQKLGNCGKIVLPRVTGDTNAFVREENEWSAG